MAQLPNGMNFDARQVEPTVPFEPVPAGYYNVRITGSEMKPTSSGKGAYLEFTMEIIDGQFKGRKVFDRLNLVNENQQAVEIAYRTLSAICRATGEYQLNDSQQLHGKCLKAKVTVRPAKGEYEANNDVKGYEPIDGAVAPGAPTPAGGQTPPWAGQQSQQPVAPASASPAPSQQSVGPRMNPQPPYQEGDVVNGHQLRGNQWVPYQPPAPTPPPAPAAPPAPPAPSMPAPGAWVPPTTAPSVPPPTTPTAPPPAAAAPPPPSGNPAAAPPPWAR